MIKQVIKEIKEIKEKNPLKAITILAPHPDDELIGCYSLLEANLITNIIYFDKLSIPQRTEGIKAVENYFKIFSSYSSEDPFIDENLFNLIENSSVILVPSIEDFHPLHKKINHFSYKFNTPIKYFYSIEKNIPFEVLSEEKIKSKKDLLNSFYPTESKLWSNEKYILFEGYRKFDYKTYAVINFEFDNLHFWQTIPDNHSQIYLKNSHRHIFKVSIYIEQFHDDRDLEYLELKYQLKKQFPDYSEQLKNKSCEMIAEIIRNYILFNFPNRSVKVQVMEDGENGALII